MKSTLVNQSFGQSSAITKRYWPVEIYKRTLETLNLYAERWIRRYRLRNSLYEMDTRLIEKDIGLPYGSLSEEASKPFWRE